MELTVGIGLIIAALGLIMTIIWKMRKRNKDRLDVLLKFRHTKFDLNKRETILILDEVESHWCKDERILFTTYFLRGCIYFYSRSSEIRKVLKRETVEMCCKFLCKLMKDSLPKAMQPNLHFPEFSEKI